MTPKRVFAQAYRMTDPCYGMSGGYSSALALPLRNSTRMDAARVRRIKGIKHMARIWFGAVVASALMSLAASASAEAKVPLPDRMQMTNLLLHLGVEKVFTSDFLARVERPGVAERDLPLPKCAQLPQPTVHVGSKADFCH